MFAFTDWTIGLCTHRLRLDISGRIAFQSVKNLFRITHSVHVNLYYMAYNVPVNHILKKYHLATVSFSILPYSSIPLPSISSLILVMSSFQK
jgi:hypothetical protein